MRSYDLYLACIGFLVVVFLNACEQHPVTKPTLNEQVSNEFSSPLAVFETFREAHSKGEWRRCFRCLTPDAQRSALFEQFFRCAESGSAEAQQIMFSHIGDLDKFRDEYKKRYK